MRCVKGILDKHFVYSHVTTKGLHLLKLASLFFRLECISHDVTPFIKRVYVCDYRFETCPWPVNIDTSKGDKDVRC